MPETAKVNALLLRNVKYCRVVTLDPREWELGPLSQDLNVHHRSNDIGAKIHALEVAWWLSRPEHILLCDDPVLIPADDYYVRLCIQSPKRSSPIYGSPTFHRENLTGYFSEDSDTASDGLPVEVVLDPRNFTHESLQDFAYLLCLPGSLVIDTYRIDGNIHGCPFFVIPENVKSEPYVTFDSKGTPLYGDM
jgi:hypothetical protein